MSRAGLEPATTALKVRLRLTPHFPPAGNQAFNYLDVARGRSGVRTFGARTSARHVAGDLRTDAKHFVPVREHASSTRQACLKAISIGRAWRRSDEDRLSCTDFLRTDFSRSSKILRGRAPSQCPSFSHQIKVALRRHAGCLAANLHSRFTAGPFCSYRKGPTSPFRGEFH